MRKFGLLLLSFLLLSGCAREATYRGVSAQHWQKLTSEQKQLIVDQAYEEEVNDIK